MTPYMYRNKKTGELITRRYRMGEAPHIINEASGSWVRDMAAEHSGARTKSNAKWPIHSDALGVHPEQVPEFRDAAKKDGVPTDFTPSGEPILNDMAHCRRYWKHRGVFDKAGFTGGPN